MLEEDNEVYDNNVELNTIQAWANTQAKIEIAKNEKRKDHFAWKYGDSKTKKEEIIYFGAEPSKESCIYKYIRYFKVQGESVYKELFFRTLDELANIVENNPTNTIAYNAEAAKLALLSMGMWDASWAEFDFHDKKHAIFCEMLLSFKDTKQLEPGLFKKALESQAVRENKYNLALSLKLFHERLNSQIEVPKKEKRLFFHILEKIHNSLPLLPQNSDKILVFSAELLLIASGLWEKKIVSTRQDIKYSQLTLEKCSTFCEFLTSTQCNEKVLKQKWFEDLLPVKILFPQQEVKNKLKSVKEDQPQKVSGYFIIKYKDEYFAADEILLGKGNFGEVYKAYRLDAEGNLFITQPYVLKISSRATLESLKKEARFNQQAGLVVVQPKEYKTWDGPRGILPMEFVPGQEMGSGGDFEKLHELLKGKTFAQRARLAREIAMAIANLHKKDLLHGDIKGSNVRLNIRKNKKTGEIIFDVIPLDFGLSEKMDNTDDDTYSIKFDAGTPGFLAPEVGSDEKAYRTTDTYSCAPFYMAIFGAIDPLKDKKDYKERKTLWWNIPYNTEGMFSDNTWEISPTYSYLEACGINFASRCQRANPKERLADNEILIFLDNFSKLAEISELRENELKELGVTKEGIAVYTAKCILVSRGLWNVEILGKKRIGDIDFELDPEIAVSIVDCYKQAYENTMKGNKRFARTFTEELKELLKNDERVQNNLKIKIIKEVIEEQFRPFAASPLEKLVKDTEQYFWRTLDEGKIGKFLMTLEDRLKDVSTRLSSEHVRALYNSLLKIRETIKENYSNELDPNLEKNAEGLQVLFESVKSTTGKTKELLQRKNNQELASGSQPKSEKTSGENIVKPTYHSY